MEKADNGTILDWSHNVYAVGRKICSASRGDIISGTLTKNFIVSDHQGNVRNVFNYDAQQNLVLNAAYWYNPFGKQDSVVVYGTGGHRFTYNDKELDDELGFEMYYYGARFYDPSIGRFSSPDPVRDYHNPYSYVRNNPIRYVDPTGMAAGGYGAPKLERGWTSSDGDDLTGFDAFNPYHAGPISSHPDFDPCEPDHTAAPDPTGGNSSSETTEPDDGSATNPSATIRGNSKQLNYYDVPEAIGDVTTEFEFELADPVSKRKGEVDGWANQEQSRRYQEVVGGSNSSDLPRGEDVGQGTPRSVQGDFYYLHNRDPRIQEIRQERIRVYDSLGIDSRRLPRSHEWELINRNPYLDFRQIGF